MKKQKKRAGRWLLASLPVLVLGGYCIWAMARPLPPATHTTQALPPYTITSKITWPSEQAAVGVLDSTTLQTNGLQTPAPTASTAKVLTALVILNAKPLGLGQTGPLLTLGTADVASYNAYNAQQGSVVPVVAGEQLSEYQALQTIMLPSANNVADSLAIWAFGSLPAYKQAAETYLAMHHLVDTHLGGDASGLDPATTSTAHDLVVIGELAMQNPVLAQIVGQTTATNIPVAGTIKNVNFLLGTNNVIGIKTGNSDQAGGVYISASTSQVDGKTQTLVTAVVGAPNLVAALNDSLPLIKSAQANFETVTVAKAGTVVGRYYLPWESVVPAIISHDLRASGFGGSTVQTDVALSPVAQNSTTVGHVSAGLAGGSTQNRVDVKLQTPPARASAWWRLTHPR